MANEYLVNSDDMTAVADAIRTKGGTSNAMIFPGGFVDAIEAIESGGSASGLTDLELLIQDKLEVFSSNITTMPGEYEFAYKRNLKKVSMPLAVGYITQRAFQNSGITEVEMPGTTIIGFDAFVGCVVTKVTFPLCTQVGSSAFNWCGKLEKADFGSSDITTVKNLGATAFQNTPALKALILRYSVVIPLENSNVFGTNSGITTGIGHVYVPSALIPEYQVATNWASIYAEYPAIFQPIEGSEYE